MDSHPHLCQKPQNKMVFFPYLHRIDEYYFSTLNQPLLSIAFLPSAVITQTMSPIYRRKIEPMLPFDRKIISVFSLLYKSRHFHALVIQHNNYCIPFFMFQFSCQFYGLQVLPPIGKKSSIFWYVSEK